MKWDTNKLKTLLITILNNKNSLAFNQETVNYLTILIPPKTISHLYLCWGIHSWNQILSLAKSLCIEKPWKITRSTFRHWRGYKRKRNLIESIWTNTHFKEVIISYNGTMLNKINIIHLCNCNLYQCNHFIMMKIPENQISIITIIKVITTIMHMNRLTLPI